MSKQSTFVGSDVHAETIAVAVVQGRDVVRSLGIVPNTPEAIRRVLGTLGPKKDLRVCYEAGPTGYVILLAVDGDGHPMRRGGALAGADEVGRPHQDGLA